jgi:hypothetical protein
MLLEEINQKISNIEKDINEIKELLVELNSKIDNNLISNCDKMGNHIDFVENVYSKFKYPLEKIGSYFVPNLKIEEGDGINLKMNPG